MFTKRTIAYVIFACGLIGLIDSFFLVTEYFAALTSGGAPTPCSPSSMVSCTKTVQGEWAHLLGVSNPLFGMLWYGMFTMYGWARVTGSTFARPFRGTVAVLTILGLVFSYTLYLASVTVLRGVCPFCLLSTMLSSIVALAFVLDDRTYIDAIFTKATLPILYILQVFFLAAYSVGMIVFLVYYIPLLVEPIQAITHWSFPVIVLLIALMVVGNIWAYKGLQQPIPRSKKEEHSSLFKRLFRIK